MSENLVLQKAALDWLWREQEGCRGARIVSKLLAAKEAWIKELEAKYARARESDLAQSEAIAALQKDALLWRKQASEDAKEIAALKAKIHNRDVECEREYHRADKAESEAAALREKVKALSGKLDQVASKLDLEMSDKMFHASKLRDTEAKLAEEQASHNRTIIDLLTPAQDEAKRWRDAFQKETLAHDASAKKLAEAVKALELRDKAIDLFFHHWQHGGVSRNNQFHQQIVYAFVQSGYKYAKVRARLTGPQPAEWETTKESVEVK